MPRVERQAAQRRGRLAETLAVWWLRVRLYRILARDWRSPVGELDIVARRGHILAIIEVKHRASLVQAAEAVSQRQQRRILRATEQFVALHPGLEKLDWRFDVLLLAPGRLPRHWLDAFRP